MYVPQTYFDIPYSLSLKPICSHKTPKIFRSERYETSWCCHWPGRRIAWLTENVDIDGARPPVSSQARCEWIKRRDIPSERPKLAAFIRVGPEGSVEFSPSALRRPIFKRSTYRSACYYSRSARGKATGMHKHLRPEGCPLNGLRATVYRKVQ
jgi:hypothetical protein